MSNGIRYAIIEYIAEYIKQHGYSPSVREIGSGVGLKSSSSVHVHLRKLFAEGKLETDAPYGTPRAIRVPGYGYVKTDPCKGCFGAANNDCQKCQEGRV